MKISKGIVKIGKLTFSNYSEYEESYLKLWKQIHTIAAPDLIWLMEDWNYRVSLTNATN